MQNARQEKDTQIQPFSDTADIYKEIYVSAVAKKIYPARRKGESLEILVSS